MDTSTKPVLVCMVGLPASGKSTIAYNYPVGINALTVSALISNHMKPWVWEKDNNEKMYNKYLKLWGDYFMQCVMILHEADKAAH